jgi:hypothetical protein
LFLWARGTRFAGEVAPVLRASARMFLEAQYHALKQLFLQQLR